MAKPQQLKNQTKHPKREKGKRTPKLGNPNNNRKLNKKGVRTIELNQTNQQTEREKREGTYT